MPPRLDALSGVTVVDVAGDDDDDMDEDDKFDEEDVDEDVDVEEEDDDEDCGFGDLDLVRSFTTATGLGP